MANLKEFQLPIMKDGIVREAAVDQTLVPEGTVEFAMNLNFDKIGAVQLRNGLTSIGSAGSIVFNTGWTDPNTVAEYDLPESSDTYNWVNVNNVLVNDANYSYRSIAVSEITQAIKTTNFGFSIPTNAIITGIEARVKRGTFAGATPPISDFAVKLFKSDNTVGSSNKAKDSSVLWEKHDVADFVSYGSSTDLWEEIISPSEINSNNFGLVFAGQNNSSGSGSTGSILRVFSIQIKVYYAFGINGIANYINNAGTNHHLLAKNNTFVYKYNTNSLGWDSVRSGLVSSSKARFTNFIDLTYMVNGTNNDALQTYNGSTFGTSNVASLPQGDFIENYRSRVWVAQNTTDKVYYSDIVNTDNTLTGGTSFIQVSPQDGEQITGLKRHPRALLVFKNNHIYRIFSINSADPDPSIDRGTYSQESIIESKGGISYHHPTGFYDFVFDGQQREISRPIIDIIKAISRSNYSNIIGWVDDSGDGDHKYWSIGDITLKGVTFNNVVCRYTISTQVWTVYSYPKQITAASLYDNGTTISNVVGDEAGNVSTFDSGTTDNDEPIFYDLITHWFSFVQIKSTKKKIGEVAVIHENAQGANLQYQIDTDIENKWRDLGTIKDDLFQVIKHEVPNFTRVRFRMSGNSIGSPFVFRGWEILTALTT